jgi:hypothetical protein
MKYRYGLDKEPNGFLCLMIFGGGYFWITAPSRFLVMARRFLEAILPDFLI